VVLEFRRTITADSDEDVRAGQVKAREWLKESGAQVLIWGKVVTAPGRPSVPELHWTNSQTTRPSVRNIYLLNTAGGIQSLRRFAKEVMPTFSHQPELKAID
jgi:hypothetical protein